MVKSKRRNLEILLLGMGLMLSSAVAQPQFSAGWSGGLSFIPSPNETPFIVGGSMWLHAVKPLWLSGEFLSSFFLVASKEFIHIIAGVHWGVF